MTGILIMRLISSYEVSMYCKCKRDLMTFLSVPVESAVTSKWLLSAADS